MAGAVTSSLSRLLTMYIQRTGFTCGMDDLLLTPRHEAQRREELQAAEAAAITAGAAIVDVDLPPLPPNIPAPVLRAAEATVRRALRPRYRQSALVATVHDQRVSSALNPVASSVTKACFPRGLTKPFLRNCMSQMTTTGAKGGLVNFSQISAMLGQQDLEGRRVPRMASGKTLPCFHAFDAGARSGGFVGDRFLTGAPPRVSDGCAQHRTDASPHRLSSPTSAVTLAGSTGGRAWLQKELRLLHKSQIYVALDLCMHLICRQGSPSLQCVRSTFRPVVRQRAALMVQSVAVLAAGYFSDTMTSCSDPA